MPIFNLFKDIKKPQEPKNEDPALDDSNIDPIELSDETAEVNNSTETNTVSEENKEKKKYDFDSYRKRTVSVRFRMTPAEKEKLDAAYKASGARSLQEYLLASALKGPVIKDIPKKDLAQYYRIVQEQEKILRQLTGIGNNINQLAKYANTKKQLSNLVDFEDVVDRMKELYNASAINTINNISKFTKVR